MRISLTTAIKTSLVLLLLGGWLVTSAQRPFRGTLAPTDPTIPIEELVDTNYVSSEKQAFIRGRFSPWVDGGIEYNNELTGLKESLRVFHFYHPYTNMHATAKFQYVGLSTGDSTWVATIDTSNVYGVTAGSKAGQVDLSSIDQDEILSWTEYDDLPINGGYPYAFSFTSDDGEDYVNTISAIFDTMGYHMTIFAVPNEVGGTGQATLSELQDIVSRGHEIGGHSLNSNVHMGQYRQLLPHDTHGGNYSLFRPVDVDVSPTVNDLRQPSTNNVYNEFEAEFNPNSLNAEFTGPYGAAKSGNEFFLYAPATDTTIGTIDSVVVKSMLRIGGAGYASVQMRFRVKYGNPASYHSSSTFPAPDNAWHEYSYSMSTNPMASSTAWTWAGVDSIAAGPSIHIYASGDTFMVAQTWLEVYWTPSLTYNGKGSAPDTLLAYNLVDCKKALEDMFMPGNFNYRAEGFAWPINLLDGRALATAASVYSYARGGARGSDSQITSLRNHDNTWTSWWYLRRYELTQNYSAVSFFGTDTSFTAAQVESATVAVIDQAAGLGDRSYRGGSLPRENTWFIINVHRETEGSPTQVEALLNALREDGRCWVVPVGEYMRYRDRAMKMKLWTEPR